VIILDNCVFLFQDDEIKG